MREKGAFKDVMGRGERLIPSFSTDEGAFRCHCFETSVIIMQDLRGRDWETHDKDSVQCEILTSWGKLPSRQCVWNSIMNKHRGLNVLWQGKQLKSETEHQID